jgi:hypothetical protein
MVKIAFRDGAVNNSLATTFSTDGSKWLKPAQPDNQIQLQGRPAMAVFNNKLYMAFRANDASNLLYVTSSSDGQSWPQASSLGIQLQDNPALAVFSQLQYL